MAYIYTKVVQQHAYCVLRNIYGFYGKFNGLYSRERI